MAFVSVAPSTPAADPHDTASSAAPAPNVRSNPARPMRSIVPLPGPGHVTGVTLRA